MKTSCKTLASFLAGLVLTAELSSAAVPTEWQVRIGPKATVYQAERYHGDALDLRATLTSGGMPLVYQGAARLYAQTNGMGALWWDLAPVTVVSNVLAATWRPEFDTGADVVDVFLGNPSNFQAHARIRFLPSPGPAPNRLPMPTPVLDFAAVDLVNVAALTNGWIFGSSFDLAAATNYTDRALGAFASTGTVARAASVGNAECWQDATGLVWRVTNANTDWHVTTNGIPFKTLSWNGTYWADDATQLSYYDGSWFFTGPWIDGSYTGSADIPSFTVEILIESYGSLVTAEVGFSRDYQTNLVGRVALTNDIPPATDLSPIEEEIADLRTESSLLYRLYSGSNVVAEVTNYNSQVHAPSLRLMQLNESNEYVTVWTETNGLARTLREATNYTDRAIADYAAPRAWSRTTSGLGADAPANTTWISTPTTVIAGGLEYAKVVDAYGEVWVLSSNGMAAEFNPDTNAYFRITADDGTPVFSIEKSDAQLVGANAAGITVGESTITIPVPVVSSVAPTMYWRASLSSGDWADELSPPAGATVTWSGAAGSWVCTVAFTGTRPSSLFFKFNFLQEGGVMIRNNATTDLSSGIWVNGTKFVPSVSGNNLIWTKQ